MIPERISCPDCDGQGFDPIEVKPCVPCKGHGWVLAAPERDALVEVIAEVCGSSTQARAALRALSANRDLLLAWLAEEEIVRPTEWGMERVPAVRPDLPRWDSRHRDAYQRVVPLEPGPNPDRLYRVVNR